MFWRDREYIIFPWEDLPLLPEDEFLFCIRERTYRQVSVIINDGEEYFRHFRWGIHQKTLERLGDIATYVYLRGVIDMFSGAYLDINSLYPHVMSIP